MTKISKQQHTNWLLSGLLTITFLSSAYSQDFQKQYEQFQKQTYQKYSSFRQECNKKYVEFLKTAWKWHESKASLPFPKEKTPIPPRPYQQEKGQSRPIVIKTTPIKPIESIPQPKPIEPIRETPNPRENYFEIDFYGQPVKVRIPSLAKLSIKDFAPNTIANGWQQLCADEMNNTIRDCLGIRIEYNLCDWAYLTFLDKLCRSFCSDSNGATLLMSFLYCQSGYQMRLAHDNQRLYMLFGCRHQIFNKRYYVIDGIPFYPFGESKSISICEGSFEGEKPMSLLINSEQHIGKVLSNKRDIRSNKFPDMTVSSQVPEELIRFYNSYPASAMDGNPMTRWSMYANAPFACMTKEKLYPLLKESIKNCSEEVAVNKLLNWVQTGFKYEYDDKIWGHDRAFFVEETLYYPFCDCEDRSILFSRLIRDLLGLDVALVYYPGHLATAVRFRSNLKGDAVIINNQRFIICDPTYIGAPAGKQMPDLEYNKVQTIILKK